MLRSTLYIAAGGAIGSVLRYWLAELVAAFVTSPFPWATVITNVLGSFVIGFYATLTGPDGRLVSGTLMRQFVMVGICGGFTTFSSFSMQTLVLVQDGEWARAGANVTASVVLCLVAVWLGHLAAAAVNQARGA